MLILPGPGSVILSASQCTEGLPATLAPAALFSGEKDSQSFQTPVMKHDTKQAVSIKPREKGQASTAGRDWQIHLFLRRRRFKCHPPTRPSRKHTLPCDEMSVSLSPDQIR